MNATTRRLQVRQRRRRHGCPGYPLLGCVAALCSFMVLALAGCSMRPVSGPPVPDVTMVPGASPVTEGTAVQFTVQAAPAPAQDLPVSVTDDGARLVAAPPPTVTVPAGETAATCTRLRNPSRRPA